MRLVLTDEALADLDDIGAWISKENPFRASSFLIELEKSCVEILNFPEKYQLVSGREKSGLRRKVYGSYLIFYRVYSGRLDIVHVLRGSRDIENLI